MENNVDDNDVVQSGFIDVCGKRLKVAVQNGLNNGLEPQFWASCGEYPIYDRLAYNLMTNDKIRSGSYLRAVNKLTPGKVVLDIGTGANLNWALASINAGAKKVYGIEELAEACEIARNKIIKLGLEDRICLLQGNSLEIELPEKVDVCISEIIGTIGSSEGVCPVLADAQKRFMKPDATMIPQRCVTHVAAAMLPNELRNNPGFGTQPFPYVGIAPINTVEKVLDSVGHAFDLRLCISGFPQNNILSTTGVIEDLHFRHKIKERYEFQTKLEIAKPGRLDGLLLWLNLWVDMEDEPINTLTQYTSWAPVYFPVFHNGVPVKPGDEIAFSCKTIISDDDVHPDYILHGTLKIDGNKSHWDFTSTHHGAEFRENPFYASLFPSV